MLYMHDRYYLLTMVLTDNIANLGQDGVWIKFIFSL